MSRRHVVLLLPALILVAAMGLKTAVTSNNGTLIAAAAPVMNGPDPAPKPWNGPDPAPKPWNGPDPAPKPW